MGISAAVRIGCSRVRFYLKEDTSKTKSPLEKQKGLLREIKQKAGKLGAKRCYELYGNPGTPEGRRKGGMTTMRRLHSDPEYAKKTKLKSRKQISYPQKSSLLAEFVGILLGDGGIKGNHQIAVSYNTETDREYAFYVQEVINKLFGISSSIYPSKKYKAAEIVVSSTNLVEFLTKKSILQKGNKITNKIDIPQWIMEDKEYRISCLRGLLDTDGGIYYHSYKINGKWYLYSRLSLYRLPEIQRYFREIGTHNPKHIERYNAYIN